MPRYICAARDGEIVSMVTRSGVPKATIGNTIHKGELLIDGVMEILDESMTITETLPVGADGDIWARVTESYNKTYPVSEESRNYGRASWKISLSFGNHSLTLGKNPYNGDDEPSYDQLTEVYHWWPGIHVQIDSFRPYTSVPSLTAVSEVKNQAEKELSDIIHEFEEKGVQILENNVKILVNGSSCRFEVNMQTEEPFKTETNVETQGEQPDDEHN